MFSGKNVLSFLLDLLSLPHQFLRCVIIDNSCELFYRFSFSLFSISLLVAYWIYESNKVYVYHSCYVILLPRHDQCFGNRIRLSPQKHRKTFSVDSTVPQVLVLSLNNSEEIVFITFITFHFHNIWLLWMQRFFLNSDVQIQRMYYWQKSFSDK